jgi:molybdate transport system ATP-binding protein
MALRDISLTLRAGGHCVFVGPNGAGKSTLLRLLHGELWPAQGSIVWHTDEGAETSPLAGKAISALVSPALQESYQRQAWEISGRDFLLTAQEETCLLYSRPDDLLCAGVENMAARFSISALLGRKLASLSQGQMRLFLLARALLRAPRLLLLDECANGLDVAARSRFFELLAEHVDKCTIVMTAHRLEFVPAWCAERYSLEDGRLLTAEAALPEIFRCGGGSGRGREEICSAAARAKPRQRCPSASSGGSAKMDILFSLKNVSVFIERHKVLHNIHWSVREGEQWQLAGANGSGKSTLLRLLAGDEFAAAGSEVLRRLPRRGLVRTLGELRKGVRLVSDLSQALYPYELSGVELVCSGFDNTLGTYRDFTEDERMSAHAIMEKFRLHHLADASIRRLSSGQLRHLFLARALVGEPEILLLDEPCNGLDAEYRPRYLDILDNLVECGMHLIFVSHYDEDVPRCVNRRARMENGRFVQS